MFFSVGNGIICISCVKFYKLYTSKQTKNHLEGNTLKSRRHLKIPEWSSFGWIMGEVQTVKVKLQPWHNSCTLVLVLSVQKENFNVSDNCWIWKTWFWGCLEELRTLHFGFKVCGGHHCKNWHIDALWIISLAVLLGCATVRAMSCLYLSSVEMSPVPHHTPKYVFWNFSLCAI